MNGGKKGPRREGKKEIVGRKRSVEEEKKTVRRKKCLLRGKKEL